jgi:hypothetical protein
MKGYQIIRCFEIKLLNKQMSQTRLSMFPNVPVKGTQLGFAVKSCQNVQIYPYFYFLFFFKKKL